MRDSFHGLLLVTVLWLAKLPAVAMPVNCGNPPPNLQIAIVATPGTLNFTLAPGTSSVQTFNLAEIGGASANTWTAAPNTAWIGVNPASGSCLSGGCGAVNITANATGLPPGTHTGAVVVSPIACGTTGTPTSVTIRLTIATVSVSLTPSSVALPVGSAAQQIAVNLSRTPAEYNGNVSISVGDLPTGVTAGIISPGTGNAGTIFLQAQPGAALVSNRPVTITASGAGITPVTTTLSVSVTAGQLVIPVGAVQTILPHSAFGAGYISRLFVTNLAAAANALTINRISQTGTVVQSTRPTLAALGTLLESDATTARSQPLTVQWFAIGSDRAVASSVLFEFDGQSLGLAPRAYRTAVGTLAATPLTEFSVPVRIATEQVTVGIALANLVGATNVINLRLRDNNGATLATDTLTLGAFSQIAFALQDRAAFRATILGPAEFLGSLAVTTDAGRPVAAIVVGNNLGQLYSLPVTPAVPPSSTLATGGPIPAGNIKTILPHSAFGAGYLSRLFVSNTSASANTITVNRLNQSGTIVQTTVTTLQPRGTLLVSDSEQQRSQPLSVQWFAIGSERPVAASVLFEFDGESLGLPLATYRAAVGTLAAPRMTDFLFPIRVATDQVTVGVALANLADTSSTMNLRLRDRNGNTAAEDTVTLPAFGQTAFALQDRPAFRTVILGVAEYVGSVSVTVTDPTKPVAAIVVGNHRGQLFSLPVSASSP